MAALFDASYPLYSPETDVLSLSSTTTTRRPGSTHTFGSGSNHNAHHVAMHRQFSDSSHQSGPRSPFGYRGDGVKLSPGNIVVLEEEIDPLDKTPQEETVIRFGKDVQRRPESSMGSSGEVTDDLFPDGSQASSHTSVHEDALRTKSTPASPNPSVTIRRATTGVIELGPIIEGPAPRSPSFTDAPTTPGQRVLRKQVPEWTASLENLEQLRITPATTPRIERSALSSSDLPANFAVPPLDAMSLSSPSGVPRDDGLLARTARRLRLGSKDKGQAAGELPREISNLDVEQGSRERRRTVPHIPARTVSLAPPAPAAPNTESAPAQHPFNHFIYAQDYAASDPTPVPIEQPQEDPTQSADSLRRPSDQTFTSGFSLTGLTDESHAPERDTPGRRLAPLAEPLSGYEGGGRFSAQPLAGMSRSFSENHLVLAVPRTNVTLDRGVSFRRKLFTLSESGLTPGTEHERSVGRGKGSPRGSPMIDQDTPFFVTPPTPPLRTRSTQPAFFSRTKSSLQVNKTANTSTTDLEPDPTSGLPFIRARRAKTRARHREAAIFAAGPDRLPTTREMLEVGRQQVYGVDGRKVAFGDIIAGGGGQQTVVVFIRHWYCPLCAEYVESIVRSVTPEVLEAANVKLVIIGNGSRRMLPAYSSKVMRCPFEMYTDPKLRVYRGLGMTRQTHDGGEEEDKGDYVTMGSVKGTLAVAKRATKMPLGRPGTIPQLGGEFIFTSALACSYAHRMINTRSHAPIRDVIALTGARLDFIHTDRGPPAPAVHRIPALGPLVETTDGMLFGNWGESGLRLSHEERRALEERRVSEGEGWRVAREVELERIRGERERRRSRIVARGGVACVADEGEGTTSGDEVAVRRV